MPWTDANVGDDAAVKHVISECVNSALATVALHAHFLVRTWLKAQGAALMLSTFASLERPHLHSRHVVTFTVSTRRNTFSTTPDHMGAPPLHSGPFGHPAFQSPLTSHEPNPHLGGSRRGTTSIRQVSVPQKVPLRKARRSPCSQVRLTILALDDWLHRCSSKREKQVSFLPEFITLKEKTPRHTLRTKARGDMLQDSHTSGYRAETE